VLAQYDTPDSILARPANEFVREFVGENRALRRLALRRLDQIELAPAAKAGAGLPTVRTSATVREAVSLMIETGARALSVVDENGETRGLVRFDDAARLLR
jgi:osmoprotectant transport system ATP-binding protein